MSADDDFAAAAERLYAGPATGFVAERNARSKAARGDGDRDLAARIAALPKPSASAALVNRLAREDRDGLDRLLALGAELREAQQDGDGQRLRTLGIRRRELLTETTRAVLERAAGDGAAPGATIVEEVQQTLQALLADEAAADAVLTGRTVRALKADGLDPVDLAGAVGGPGATAAPPARRTPPRQQDEVGEARRLRDAKAVARQEQEAAEAARQADEADHEADRAAARARDAGEVAQRREEEADALRRRLAEAQEALKDAEGASADARKQAASADAEARKAASTADASRAAADEAAARASFLQG